MSLFKNLLLIVVFIISFPYHRIKVMSCPKVTPAIFFGHGSPMNAIEQNKFTSEWISLMRRFSEPTAILAISAHWETKGTKLTNNKIQKTIHDFGGFPQELFRVQYNPSGDQDLVKRIQTLVPEAAPDDSWGLDHGTWSILKNIYPLANIPVVQLSIDVRKSNEEHFKLAQKLKALRNENILIIGSGNIVHNLGLVNWNSDTGYPWAFEFNNAVKHAISSRDYSQIINYERLEHSQKAVPSSEHFIPLIYVLGLQNDDETANFFTDELFMGSLSMTSVLIQ